MKTHNHLVMIQAVFAGILLIFPTLIQPLTRNEVLSHKPIKEAMTINVPGTYSLARNIQGQITIASDNVSIDLNNYTIQNGANGIVLSAGVKGIEIENGTISSVTGDGIQIGAGCQNFDSCTP